MSLPWLTRTRAAVAAALVFLLAATLAGVQPGPAGTRYEIFALPEGIFALLLTYLLLLRGVWRRPLAPLDWLPVAYGTVANAQLLALLFPPPGVIEWVVITALAMTAWGALGSGSRTRVLASLGSLALLLALLKFSVIPVLYGRLGPRAGEAFGLGDVAEGARRFFADYQPVSPGAQVLGFLAICAWAAGTRLLWTGDVAREAVRAE